MTFTGNINWSRRLLEELHREGVREILCCAGARNSPLVSVLAKTSGIEVHSFFEERSAAFFALGAARRSGRPVVVVTTSGTAAAELLPATIEAFHTGVPLILLTADRPRRLRGTGAPQAIDQTGLFAKFVEKEFDLENGELFSLANWTRRAPVHVNVCLDEPLLDAPIEPFDLAALERSSSSFKGRAALTATDAAAAIDFAAHKLSRFIAGASELVAVVGTLETEAEQEAVAQFLLALGAPAYLEGTSGLRERPELQPLALRSGDKVLAWALKQNKASEQKVVTHVLRIGGVPTVRIWRDLDEAKSEIEVFSLSPLMFAGLSRGQFICAEIAPVLAATQPRRKDQRQGTQGASLLEKDRVAERELLSLLAEEPKAEPSLVHALSKLPPHDALVYVGNSLPIREWDLAATYDRLRAVEANRGVNGIDGQISTFLGLAGPGRENWMMLGDLTAMYDLASPWALAARPDVPVRIVVVNNGGGKIFSRIFNTSLFENRHDFAFEHWARMWRLGYRRWTSVPASLDDASLADVALAEVIELVPDDEATRRFWDRYDRLWV
jgi:2-succinyl-5-enolpyruvyl-6-hydroxy-3-cyclohexene-1-carboxylate synthase